LAGLPATTVATPLAAHSWSSVYNSWRAELFSEHAGWAGNSRHKVCSHCTAANCVFTNINTLRSALT